MKAKDYNTINTLLATYSTTIAEVKACEGTIQMRQLKAARALLPEHARKKTLLAELEAELKALALRYSAELFPAQEDRRNHKTPFGEMGFHRSSSLAYREEDAVLARIRSACLTEAQAADTERRDPRFTTGQLIRVSEEPNLEAIETLDDQVLQQLGITRVIKDNFKIKPAAMKSDKPARVESDGEAQ